MLAPDNTDPSEEQPLINPINTKIKLKYPKWLAYSILTSVPFLHLFSYLLSIYILGQYTYVYFLEAKYPNVTHTLSGSLSACTVNKSSIEYFIESDIQKEAAKWTIYVYLALLIPSFLMNINLATYSDALGRKAFFIIPLVGTLIKTALCALGIYLKLNVKILLAFYMVEAITGTWTGTIAMSFCFIADTTEPGKPRSFLIGLIEGGIGLGAILASFASGYLITWTNGFFYPIVIAAVLVGISLLIVILFIQETLHPARRRQNISLLRNMNRVLEVYRSGFSPDTPRWIFVVLIIIFMCSAAANLGKMSVESIYFVDSPFCWSTEQIGIYGAMRIIFSNVCGIFVIKIFHIWTNDEVIALFGCLTTTACLILEGIARSNLVMYMSAVAGIGCTVTMPMVRGIMSRLAPADKQGSVFAGVAAVETFFSSLGSVAMGTLYDATVGMLKGLPFLIWSGFGVIGLMFSFILVSNQKKAVYIAIGQEITERTDIDKNKHVNFLETR